MRDVVLYSLLSLDGVAEEPSDWMSEADEDLLTNLSEVIRSQDDILLGRGTYDYWADYWPTSDVQPFADFVNGTTKHVFTSSAPTVSWSQSTTVEDRPVPTSTRSRGARGGHRGAREHPSRAEPAGRRPRRPARARRRADPRRVGTSAFPDGLDLRRLTLTKATRSATGCVFLGYRRP